MKKIGLMLALLIGTPAMACEYITQITSTDKYNSNGVYLAGGVNKATVAAILRQNRAYAESDECNLGSAKARQSLEKRLNSADIPPSLMAKIVHGEPWIRVVILKNKIMVREY